MSGSTVLTGLVTSLGLVWLYWSYRLHVCPSSSFLTSVDSGLGSLASGFPGQAEVVHENGTIISQVDPEGLDWAALFGTQAKKALYKFQAWTGSSQAALRGPCPQTRTMGHVLKPFLRVL